MTNFYKKLVNPRNLCIPHWRLGLFFLSLLSSFLFPLFKIVYLCKFGRRLNGTFQPNILMLHINIQFIISHLFVLLCLIIPGGDQVLLYGFANGY